MPTSRNSRRRTWRPPSAPTSASPGPRLEARFNALRGLIRDGRQGDPLIADLDSLHGEITASMRQIDAERAGSFGLAFTLSLGTILREGVEVILLLTMLIAVAAK